MLHGMTARVGCECPAQASASQPFPKRSRLIGGVMPDVKRVEQIAQRVYPLTLISCLIALVVAVPSFLLRDVLLAAPTSGFRHAACGVVDRVAELPNRFSRSGDMHS